MYTIHNINNDLHLDPNFLIKQFAKKKTTNNNFNLKMFAKKYYHDERKGNGYAIGHMDQRRTLGNRKYLMPITFDRNDIWIAPSEIFYTTANAAQMIGRTFLTQKGIKYMGTYLQNFNDQKELRSMLPNFQLKVLQKWIKVHSTQNYQNAVLFHPFNYYGSFGQVGYPVISFHAVSQSTQKYKELLGTDNRIFMKPYIKKNTKAT